MTETPCLARLKVAGVELDQVDVVMCTHLHVDHVGWTDFAHCLTVASDSKTAPANAGSFRVSALPVVEAGLSQLVDGAAQLDENFEVEPAPGHTPGTIAIKFDSRGEKALFCGDILHHALRVHHPEWNSFACAAPDALPSGAPFTCHIDQQGSGFVPRFDARAE